ncbi:MAG: hypothetical protein V7749_03520 [Cocleimonas sp.]
MKILPRISTFVFLSLFISGCSNFTGPRFNYEGSVKNPLKTNKDLKIEKVLISGIWTYERQSDDCKDTNWVQSFDSNRYYRSVGAACLIPNAFSVDAENWYLKDQILYVTNLSPDSDNDIILRYGIDYLDQNRLVLSSGEYKYTFLK